MALMSSMRATSRPPTVPSLLANSNLAHMAFRAKCRTATVRRIRRSWLTSNMRIFPSKLVVLVPCVPGRLCDVAPMGCHGVDRALLAAGLFSTPLRLIRKVVLLLGTKLPSDERGQEVD